MQCVQVQAASGCCQTCYADLVPCLVPRHRGGNGCLILANVFPKVRRGNHNDDMHCKLNLQILSGAAILQAPLIAKLVTWFAVNIAPMGQQLVCIGYCKPSAQSKQRPQEGTLGSGTRKHMNSDQSWSSARALTMPPW